jgi:hypothetical protein
MPAFEVENGKTGMPERGMFKGLNPVSIRSAMGEFWRPSLVRFRLLVDSMRQRFHT